MNTSFLKEAERQGFEQGWFDGLHGQPVHPKPVLGVGLFDLDYLKVFKAAYLDGHATLKAEMDNRRKALLQTRSHQHSIEHERSDV